MIASSRAWMLAFVFGVASASAGAAADDAVARCDALAASPYDSSVPGGGPRYDRLDADKAIEACTAAVAAEPGVARLAFQLARGLDKAGRFEEAAATYRDASDRGHLPALHALASMYQYGDGVPQDYAKARALFGEAAGKGFALSSAELGWMAESGEGAPADDVEAVRLYRTAAEAGIDVAENNLGAMYENGRGGLAKDMARAVELYRRAADRGNGLAASNLATVLSNGRGVPRDLAEAERLYRLAGDSAEPEAAPKGWNGLAWLYAVQGRRLDEALTLSRKAVAAKGDDMGYRDTLAYALHRKGENEEALKLQRTVVDALPKNANFRARLGDMFDALGRHAEAKAAWRRSLDAEWDPDELDFSRADYETKLARP